MKGSVEQRVTAILARATDRPRESFAADTTLSSLGFGSLDQIECMLAIEDEFRVEVNEREAQGLKTVGDIIALVQATLARQTTPR